MEKPVSISQNHHSKLPHAFIANFPRSTGAARQAHPCVPAPAAGKLEAEASLAIATRRADADSTVAIILSRYPSLRRSFLSNATWDFHDALHRAADRIAGGKRQYHDTVEQKEILCLAGLLG